MQLEVLLVVVDLALGDEHDLGVDALEHVLELVLLAHVDGEVEVELELPDRLEPPVVGRDLEREDDGVGPRGRDRRRLAVARENREPRAGADPLDVGCAHRDPLRSGLLRDRGQRLDVTLEHGDDGDAVALGDRLAETAHEERKLRRRSGARRS